MSRFLVQVRIEIEIECSNDEVDPQDIAMRIRPELANNMTVSTTSRQMQYSVTVDRLPEKINGV